MFGMKMYIYIIQNKINNKIYIGQTNNPKIRWWAHKNPSSWKKQKHSHLYRSMEKHGKENFTFSVIHELNNQPDANDIEEFLIEFFDTRNHNIGYNIANGGNNKKMSDETKAKLSLAHKGKRLGKKASEETRLKMSVSQKGKNKGKILTQETKNKISKFQSERKRKPHSKKTKQKMSLTKMGKKFSEETKKNMSLAHTGKSSPKKGKSYNKNNTSTHKQCSECGKILLHNKFYKNKSQTDGLSGMCKVCYNEKYRNKK